ncbi:SAM-dependent methyltransferase [Streptomyces sp. NPDC050535]|uniref:SAM-dependent methyltransferase n=1 Tax=Streptomyces sp. NPDC050535 TaxID=3365626 RepID=UPI0037AFC4EA
MECAVDAPTGGAALKRGRVPQLDVLDVHSPSVARMNNYLLGGKDHYPADREVCERLLRIAPGARRVAEAGHRFLLRVTSRLARDYGVRQFVVFGAGLPTPLGVHQIAQHVDPRARTVYADADRLALVYNRALWEDRRHTLAVRADPLHAAHLLLDPEVEGFIDLTRPVAALFVSGLHTIPGPADPAGILGQTARLLAPGSFIAASHLVSEDARLRRQASDLMLRATGGRWGRVRSRAEVGRFFDTLRLLAPELVDVCQWRPGSDRAAAAGSPTWAEHGGVAMIR